MRSHHRRRGLFPFRRFVTARLHRRLFFWFAASIVVTAFTMFAVVRLVERGDAQSWSGRLERVRGFLGGRFAVVWSDAARRDELATSLARELELDVTLQDAEGRTLTVTGRGPCRKGAFVAVVGDAGAPLGRVLVCPERRRHVLQIVFPFAAALTVLWAASGILARRLSRPLEDLARSAEAMGRTRGEALVPPSSRGGSDLEEVRAVSTAMDGMAARIQKQLDDQRALLAAVSHEIRTPLSRMRLLLEMARDRLGDDRVLGDIDREVLDVDALVSELLASSRMDFAALSPKALSAEEVARLALERAGVDAAVLQVEEPGLVFQGDPTLVQRAVGNLVQNAAVHGGGVLALRLRGGDGGRAVTFEVDDGGPGFAPGEEEQVFRPFHRGKGSGASLGLGLSLVRRIAEAHGGQAYARTRRDPSTGAAVGATVGVSFARRPPASA